MEASLQALVSMGFSQDAAEFALEATSGDAAAAVELCILQQGSVPTDQLAPYPPAASDSFVEHCFGNQGSVHATKQLRRLADLIGEPTEGLLIEDELLQKYGELPEFWHFAIGHLQHVKKVWARGIYNQDGTQGGPAENRCFQDEHALALIIYCETQHRYMKYGEIPGTNTWALSFIPDFTRALNNEDRSLGLQVFTHTLYQAIVEAQDDSDLVENSPMIYYHGRRIPANHPVGREWMTCTTGDVVQNNSFIACIACKNTVIQMQGANTPHVQGQGWTYIWSDPKEEELYTGQDVSERTGCIIEFRCRPSDHVGLHMPSSPPKLLDRHGILHNTFPPLTAFLVKSVENTHCRYIVVEPTFTPQVFGSLLKAPKDVWDSIAGNDDSALQTWLGSFPVLNLEETHPEYGCTLLYSAARYGNVDALRQLIQRCAHVDSQLSRAKSTPLHVAAFYGHASAVSFLLDCNANWQLRNAHGSTPIEEAQSAGNVEVTTIFQAHPWCAIEAIAGAAADPVIESRFSGKFLRYGERNHFLLGLETFLGPQPSNLMQAMHQEFSRDLKWTDCHAGYTPGAYDAQTVWQEAESSLAELRCKPEAEGLEDFEILGLHLYTKAAYKPVNDFLRELLFSQRKGRALTVIERGELLAKNADPDDKTPLVSWVAFTWSVYLAFLKLARREEAQAMAIPANERVQMYGARQRFRGIGMGLSPEFFIPDERGMVAATEFGFGSTSKMLDTATQFAQQNADIQTGGAMVVMCVHSCQRDATGFHSGVDIAWASAVPTEEEVLFPPLTLFKVMRSEREGHLITLHVCPTWVEPALEV
jgi:ankyrin repeat protein